MSAYEQYTQLYKMYRALMDELQKISGPVQKLSCEIMGFRDRLTTPALAEIAEDPKLKKVVVAENLLPDDEEVKLNAQPPKPEEFVAGRKKRACSLCRQTGHWAKNCPNAHLVRDQEVKRRQKGEPKKPKKILTPEHKAKLREALAKARKAKKEKNK